MTQTTIYQFKGAHYREALPGEQIDQRGVGNTGMVWPVYKSEAEQERQQVEDVFLLGGGELEDESFAGYQYNYSGVPDYASSDFPGVYDSGDDQHQYHTVIVTGGGYLPNPKKTLTDKDGVTWELVKTYTSSGETDCGVCGRGTDAFETGFQEAYGRRAGPGDECGLCETKYEDMPGYVFVGEGYEAVYRTHNRNIWPEDYDDGPDEY